MSLPLTRLMSLEGQREADADGYSLGLYTSQVIGGTVDLVEYPIGMWLDAVLYCEEAAAGTRGHPISWQIAEIWIHGPAGDMAMLQRWIRGEPE